MNDYMRENKIEPVPPQLTAQAGNAPAVRSRSSDGAAEVSAAR
jgi:hypothetical protein